MQNKLLQSYLFLFSYGYFTILCVTIFLGISTRVVTIPLSCIIILILALIIALNKNKDKNTTTMLLANLAFMGFSCLYVIKILFLSINGYSASREWYEYIIYYTMYCVLPFIAFSKLNYGNYKHTLINTLIFSSFVFSLVTIYAYWEILFLGVGRLSKAIYFNGQETINPLSLAYPAALNVSLSLYKIFNYKLKKSTLIYILTGIILSLILIVIGASRGPIICVLFSFFLLAAFKTKKVVFYAFGLFLITSVLGSFFQSELFDRLEKTSSGYKTQQRLEQYNVALNEFKDHPLFGGVIEKNGIYPHNFFLEIMMSTGLIGTILFSILIYIAFKKALVLIRKDESFLLIILILANGIIMHSLSFAFYTSVLIFMPISILIYTPVSNLKKN